MGRAVGRVEVVGCSVGASDGCRVAGGSGVLVGAGVVGELDGNADGDCVAHT